MFFIQKKNTKIDKTKVHLSTNGEMPCLYMERHKLNPSKNHKKEQMLGLTGAVISKKKKK
jgi:hypothetical protein